MSAMARIEARKLAELSGKLESVRGELERWRADTAPSRVLRLHRTQIERVTGVLDGFAGSIEQRLGALAGDGSRLLARALDIEIMILELHRIWEFFRAKLALRYVDWFAPHLAAADELAFRCYEPARACIAAGHMPSGGLTEPPLTFFNGGSTPWTVPRGRAFAAEDVPGEGLRTPQFAALLQRLPIPLVGVPWHQVEHLPDALVIAHEAGHLIVEDLRLAPRLATAIAAAVRDDHADAWSAWADEAIADVLGAHLTGPAFGGALLDFLVDDPWSLANEAQVAPDWSPYPTRTLRIALIAEALRNSGFPAAADELHASWRELAGDGAMPAFDADVVPVVDAILCTPHPELGGRALAAIGAFGAAEQEAALATASRGLSRRALTAADPRVLVAGARLAFERDADAYRRFELDAKVRRRIVDARPEGTRAAGAHAVPAAADAALGVGLADLFTTTGETDVQAH